MDRYFLIDLSLFVPSSDKNGTRVLVPVAALQINISFILFTLLSNAVCPDLLKCVANVAACTGHTAVQPLLLAGTALHFPEGAVRYRQAYQLSAQAILKETA